MRLFEKERESSLRILIVIFLSQTSILKIEMTIFVIRN